MALQSYDLVLSHHTHIPYLNLPASPIIACISHCRHEVYSPTIEWGFHTIQFCCHFFAHAWSAVVLALHVFYNTMGASLRSQLQGGREGRWGRRSHRKLQRLLMLPSEYTLPCLAIFWWQ